MRLFLDESRQSVTEDVMIPFVGVSYQKDCRLPPPHNSGQNHGFDTLSRKRGSGYAKLSGACSSGDNSANAYDRA
jgi:hypothetical protein